MANNLRQGSHQVVLSNVGSGSNSRTDLDYAIVTVWSASNNSSPNPTQATHKSKAGAIAGGAVGGVVFLALLLGGLFFWFRRRRRRRASYAADVNNEDSATHLLPHAAFISPFVKVPVNPAASASGHAPPDEAMPPPTYNYVFGELVPDASAGRVVPETSSATAVRPLPSPPAREKTQV
jgi:cbb3-type cytochrome oxidase subunit 3